MQKILIIGAGSLGIAAQLSSLASEKDLPMVFLASPEPDLVMQQHVDEPHYQPAAWRNAMPALVLAQHMEEYSRTYQERFDRRADGLAQHVADYNPLPASHSFEFNYKPTSLEVEWLRAHAALEEKQRVMDDLTAGVYIHNSRWSCFEESLLYPKWPKHRVQFTRSQPTRKARKAARRRQKAGRKVAR